MINLIFTVAGLILVLGGLYTMTLGFSTPPSMVMFIGGLIAFVVGAIIIVIFAGKINLGSKNKSKSEKPSKKEKAAQKSVKKPVKPVKSEESVKKPVKPVKSEESVKSVKEIKQPSKVVPSDKSNITESKDESVAEIKPKRVRRTFKSKEPNQAKVPKPEPKEESKTEEISKGSTNLFSKLKEKSKSSSSKKAAVATTATTTATSAGVVASESKESKRPNPKRKIPNPKKRSTLPRPTGPKSKDTGDNSYVAKRLNMLKQEYVEGIGDVDKFIDEKIGSLNETTDVASGNLTPKTISSGGSNLIWSFESFDVQDSLKDTLIKSKSRLVMMYPWIRNIDVGILKKFIDIDSRLIIQEAGLDDDASVELIKLLMDNGVEIRTMPHIHTVAAVSDEDEGLIISTDPIYDSFEVGVKYTDSESIKQINNLFEEAWKLSKPIEL